MIILTDFQQKITSLLPDIELRMEIYEKKLTELVGEDGSLSDFANGHEYFGFHRTADGWVYREWAPAAEEIWLTGDMVEWRWFDLKLEPIGNGIFEIYMQGENFLYNGCHVQAIVKHNGSFFRVIFNFP